MLDRSGRGSLNLGTLEDSEGDGWLMSYLDVLTLLITLFVLLLSLSGSGVATEGNRFSGNSPISAAEAVTASASLVPLGSGLMPRSDGMKKRFREMDLEGVSVSESEKGITLRIDNSLLFASGDASLTNEGRTLIEDLVPTILELNGDVSVEGHTDNMPISTTRFPSNWELSTRRATSVLRRLVESGLPSKGLRAIGYADTLPLGSNNSAEGRAANRRVELLVTRSED